MLNISTGSHFTNVVTVQVDGKVLPNALNPAEHPQASRPKAPFRPSKASHHGAHTEDHATDSFLTQPGAVSFGPSTFPHFRFLGFQNPTVPRAEMTIRKLLGHPFS